VDGAQTEIYRADYVFRAVYLTAGSHEVKFAYQPDSFRCGVWISVLALAAALVMSLRPDTLLRTPPEDQAQVNGRNHER
jgi:uncharacterized membrane protein YfhO